MTVDRHLLDRRRSERRRLQSLADRLPPLTERDLEDVRAAWWRQAALGNRMPAEYGVIVVDGGRR